MGKIYYMMGKSSSGKDTLFKEVKKALPWLQTITLYTTRPIREGERDGIEYFFVSEDTLNAYEKQGKVIEQRAYDTVHGIWKYATVDDGQINLGTSDYLVIGTLQSYEQMQKFYGPDKLVPIYIEVEDGERLARALAREREQEVPKYAELCRRFLADQEDFSEEKIAAAGITRKFQNVDLEECVEEITEYIRQA